MGVVSRIWEAGKSFEIRVAKDTARSFDVRKSGWAFKRWNQERTNGEA